MGMYLRFGLMIATSTLAMFAMSYLNVFEADHVFFSETRAYMALVMGAGMALVMMAYMWHMYPNKGANLAIVMAALLVFAGALALVRSQRTVDQVSYMKAMIPHHSIAILTSERAQLEDPRVRELASSISRTQKEEIARMKALIEALD